LAGRAWVPALAEHNGTLYVAYRGLTTNRIYYEKFNSISDLRRSPYKQQGAILALTNTIAGGLFTTPVLLGSNFQVANLIIDIGSSALVVSPTKYNPLNPVDLYVENTALAQSGAYGTGSQWWFGPVVTTSLTLPVLGSGTAPDLNMGFAGLSVGIAVVASQSNPVFRGADGIMGLSYGSSAYDVSSYLESKGQSPPLTFPWPLVLYPPVPSPPSPPAETYNSSSFGKFIANLNPPASPVPVPPCFTQLEQSGQLPNKFWLSVLRATVNHRMPDPTQDTSNWGYLYLGGGEEWFGSLPVQIAQVQLAPADPDSWYYLNLISIQVDGFEAIFPSVAQAVPANAFVDSGFPTLTLPQVLYTQVVALLGSINPNFSAMISSGFVPNYELNDFTEWPDIWFTFAGVEGDAVLVCTAEQYWQTDSRPGQAQFRLADQTTVHTVVGLPMLSGYYVVFDRSVGNGVIKLARRPGSGS
jgi:hypothetical protein